MNHSNRKTVFTIIVASLSMIIISAMYTVYSVRDLSSTSSIEYPTIITEGVAPRNVVGVVIDRNLTIIMVEPDSAAKQAGLEAGDVVLEINGQPVKTIDDVSKAVSDVVIVLPTESAESAKLPQEVKDATAAAYVESSVALKDVDKVIISVMKSNSERITINIDKRPQGATADVTPTPVSLDDLYF